MQVHRPEGPTLEVYSSAAQIDPDWARFVESCPQGHFQQSDAWAQYKAGEGWACDRTILREGDTPRAGFQLLYKKTRAGRIAYIMKGPVVPEQPGYESVRDRLTLELKAALRRLGIRALVLQVPDADAAYADYLSGQGFFVLDRSQIVDATLCVPVGAARPEWRREIRKSTQYQARKAAKRGVVVRHGSDADLPVFFDLMLTTCQRQKTTPNPASLEALQRLWQSFRSRNQIHLLFAEFEGKPLAAVLCIVFGTRVTLWKKGWNMQHSDLHPNVLVTQEAIDWTERSGYTLHDFAAFDRGIAETVLRGQALSDTQRSSRHFFFLGFGGSPQLLPKAQLFVPNPLLRTGARLFIPVFNRIRQLRNRQPAGPAPAPRESDNSAPQMATTPSDHEPPPSP